MMKTLSRHFMLALCFALALGCGSDGDDGEPGAPGADGTDGTDGTDGLNAADFTFREDAPTAYTQVDRMGMPAINTAVITSKDAYNADDPAGDANGDYVTEITTNVTALHTALDDDLAGINFTPCAAADCVAAAAPLVVPDTLKIDRNAGAGFPNGRMLADQVMDVTLALVLLDVTTPGDCDGNDCTVTTLAEIPLNPAANDVEFLPFFPYVAPPF